MLVTTWIMWVDESVQEARRDAEELGSDVALRRTRRQEANNELVRLECRRDDGSVLGMGSGTGG